MLAFFRIQLHIPGFMRVITQYFGEKGSQFNNISRIVPGPPIVNYFK